MSAVVDLALVANMYRDHYPAPGERIKQYVVDGRREAAWERDTCPQFDVDVHEDNTGAGCRNAGLTWWTYLESHDCCYVCNDAADAARGTPSLESWLLERAKRPPIETDRDKLSDEVQPDYMMLPNPALAFFKVDE